MLIPLVVVLALAAVVVIAGCLFAGVCLLAGWIGARVDAGKARHSKC